MARNSELIALRNKQIKKDYDELYNRKGVRHDWCLQQLSQKYFINTETIHRIIFAKPQKDKPP